MGGRALVCGGGGVTGIAWEIGMLAGLADAGVDLSAADVVIGTSAGSFVGTGVAAGVPLSDLYESQLAPPETGTPAKLGWGSVASWVWASATSRDPVRAAARVGAMALRAPTMPEERRRAAIASRLPALEWPERELRIVAVDAVSGETSVFTRESGVEVVDAVGASCAVPGVWPPVTINGRRYVDGGVRSTTNVDLAAGCDRVVLLAPIPRSLGRHGRLDRQLTTLRRAGAEVVVVAPDAAARRAIGRNVLDPAARAPSARAGRAQAAAEAERVAAVWSA
ncbi:patatin-like phospholipase family protein [Asanoa sp. WMMD1127]|uniref:patatin-like phospholipase family protein n=1 Tax=Asanoa sp. WMMD1127 TaxID=3016107 RepID=UPI0024164022|nr:patatin-like phospholipase family protein [Asanoa sp. WMMD1127]MDG4826068.1 patatin-like phospholipase family protein [Asanoa sp. WMMD1127]